MVHKGYSPIGLTLSRRASVPMMLELEPHLDWREQQVVHHLNLKDYEKAVFAEIPQHNLDEAADHGAGRLSCLKRPRPVTGGCGSTCQVRLTTSGPLNDMDRQQEAIVYFNKAIEINPHYEAAWAQKDI
jgi:hypothetical protein